MTSVARRRVAPLATAALLLMTTAVGQLVPWLVDTGLSAQEPPKLPDAADSTGVQASGAVLAVDRLIQAFNRGDREALLAAFTPDATFSRFNWLVDDFRRGDRPGPDYMSWMLGSGWKYQIEVLERTTYGSFVFQRQRLAYTRPDGRTGHSEGAVMYKARDGRVQAIWELPPLAQDPRVVPVVERPNFGPGTGPLVFMDVAHFNHHKPELSYWPFAELLRRDGYEVRSWPLEFRKAALDSAGVEVLVIANATAEKNAEEEIGAWAQPTPSAFTSKEVSEVEAWVSEGGSLLLIADHIPWGGAAADLAAAFGAEFHNGLARDTAGPPPDIFRRADGTLRGHPVTDGWSGEERVDSIATFTGQAFRAAAPEAGGASLEPLLVFRESAVLFQPEAMGGISADTPRIPVAGWWQGAAGRHGRGRVALFGEAAMFRVLNEEAGLKPGLDNARLVLNTIRWLVAR